MNSRVGTGYGYRELLGGVKEWLKVLKMDWEWCLRYLVNNGFAHVTSARYFLRRRPGEKPREAGLCEGLGEVRWHHEQSSFIKIVDKGRFFLG